MNRTDRLYAIAEALRAAGPAGLTSAALADRFEVTARTVKRDVTALQEAGLPVTGIGGPGGGYLLDAGATLPPVTFTVGEAIAVAVALATNGDQPFAADGRRALTKLLGVVPATQRPEADTLAGRVWVRDARPDGGGRGGAPPPGSVAGGDRASGVGPVPDVDRARGAGQVSGADRVAGGRASSGRASSDHVPGDGRMDRSVVRVVEEAVRTGTVVVLDYVDRSGSRSTRRPVEAQGLAHDGGNWHLLAWCTQRDAPRWFRLDRITAAVPTATPVTARDVATAFGVPPADAGPLTLT